MPNRWERHDDHAGGEHDREGEQSMPERILPPMERAPRLGVEC